MLPRQPKQVLPTRAKLESQLELVLKAEHLALALLEFAQSRLQRESNGLLHKQEELPVRQLTGEMLVNQFVHLAERSACGRSVGVL